MKKFILTDETIEMFGVTLHRIKAVRSFGNVKEGDLGGFVEKEENISEDFEAWVSGNAKVWGDAKVWGNAEVSGNAEVWGNAKVWGDAKVWGNAEVSGNAEVWGNAEVSGNAKVWGNADYIVFKNWWSSGRYFTWTRSNNMWSVGCFYGTGEELIKKAYADSEKSGREYERVVRFVESILEDEKNEK